MTTGAAVTGTSSSVLGLLKNFSGWTSSHCIPQIGAATNQCLRIFWIVFFVCCCAMFAYLGIYVVLTKYYSYPVFVATDLKFEERAFPAITVCNLNPFKKSQVEKQETLSDLMNEFSQALRDPTKISNNDTWGFRNVEKYVTLITKAKQNLLFASRQLPVEELRHMSYYLDEFIMECAYEQQPCDMNRDWKTIYDPTYGTCFQFNNEEPPIYLNTRNGQEYGLELLMRVDQEELLSTTEIAGARVTAHVAGQHPYPEAFGYSAANGLAVNFAIKYEEMHRMPHPYGRCTKTKEGISPFYYEGMYTTEACIRSCVQEAIVRDCGCGDPLLQLAENRTAGYCGVMQQPCVRKFDLPQARADGVQSQNVNFTYDYCNCPQACDEKTYGVVMGSAKWPTQTYAPPDCYNTSVWGRMSNCLDWYHENTVRVNIYFERMDFKLYAESPAYTMQSILYDLGGQFGLWLGFSSITIVEFFALSILIFMLVSASNNGPQLSNDVKKDMQYDKEDKDEKQIKEIMKDEDEDDKSNGSDDDSSSSSSEEDSSSSEESESKSESASDSDSDGSKSNE